MTLRSQIASGFAVLLVPVVVIALVAVAVIRGLGGAVDRVLLENERSLEAAAQMDQALERIDSAALLLLLDRAPEAEAIAAAAVPQFERAFETSAGNVTIEGEGAVIEDLGASFEAYTAAYAAVEAASGDEARGAYAGEMAPAFGRVRGALARLTEMNRAAAAGAGAEAGDLARGALWAIVIGALVAIALGAWSAAKLSRQIAARYEG